MNEIASFFRGLFDTDKWPPRWRCGEWSDFHGWLYIVSDLMVWLAYFLIPAIILNYFSQKKHKIRFQAIYLLFAAFILLCGTTHFLDALMFWIPAYRLNALVRFVTGVVSLLTVYHLIRLLPTISKSPTSLELELEIEQRRKAEEQLAEANHKLAAFAAIASHDLQEPVRKIIVYSQMLETQNAGSFDTASKTTTSKIIQSAMRMQRLIKEVLALSSLEFKEELKLCDPALAINTAVDTLAIKIAETNAEINVDRLDQIYGSEGYLIQLFTNLIGNALKFNNEKPIINIRGAVVDDSYVIEVEDNGIGIPPQHASEVFEPFKRLHGKGSKFQGNGLGLAICQRIMEIHQGKISLKPNQDTGTTVLLHFPLTISHNQEK